MTERIAAVSAARDTHGAVPGSVRAVFDYALGQLAAEQQWLTAYRAELAGPGNQTSSTSPHRGADTDDPL